MVITCPYCGREEVEAWDYANSDLNVTVDDNMEIHCNREVCVDCLNVALHFVKKGLRSFRESLENSKQLDLFPADKLIDKS